MCILGSCNATKKISTENEQSILNSDTKTPYELAIAGFEQCLKNDDYSKLEPFLSEAFKAGDYPSPVVHQVIPQILQQYPNLISSEMKATKDKKATVDLVFDQIGATSTTITFDTEDRITNISLFDDILGMSATASTEGFEKVNFFKVPFEIVGEGLILLKAKLNGIEEDFILDSGAPAVVINTTSKGKQSGNAQGVAGEVSMSEVKVESFDWNGIRCDEHTFIGMDLSHLEDAIDRPFIGLIGFTAIKDYIIFIDYDAKLLSLTAKVSDLGAVDNSLLFEYQAHIPVIKVEIDDTMYSVGIDTGAESNLLSIDEYKSLDKKQTKLIEQTDLIGADGNELIVDYFTINNLTINDFSYNNMEFVASDISHLTTGYGLEIAGLLGYPFLRNRKVAIDFKEGKLYFME